MDSATRIRTLKVTSRNREAIKPAELIQVTGHHDLTLNARRAITILWYHAHTQGVTEGRDYTIEIDELKPDGHKGYEMVEEAIEALMRTLIIVRLPDGSRRRVQFLGGNDLDDPGRAGGVLTYSFDKRLIDILKDSTIWGKIALPFVMALSSKYAISLYENVAQLVNLDKKTAHSWDLEEFRELMGVQAGRYKTFGEFNKHVLSRTSRNQKGRRRPSAVRATLDDPPIHTRPNIPAISGCKAKEPFRFRPLRHMQGGTAAVQSQRIFCRKRQESGHKGLKPAVTEVNALAPFGIDVQPMKQGKRVARITVAWSTKGVDAINAAWKELQASKVGRRARINGTAEHVADPLPSVRRLLRQARLADPSPETS